MASKNYLRVDWKDFQKIMNTLAWKINNETKKEKPQYVYGIPRGGLISAVILSHKLDIPLIDTEHLIKLKNGPRVLIVDDISDKGKSLISLLSKKVKCKFVTTTLYVKESTKFVPDFWIYKVADNVWVEFPWENE